MAGVQRSSEERCSPVFGRSHGSGSNGGGCSVLQRLLGDAVV